uniref:Uncharacterized protein n=1 Tax=Arundo donax TaxID=35708 RepID=A0A0A8ZCK3_ARUDO
MQIRQHMYTSANMHNSNLYFLSKNNGKGTITSDECIDQQHDRTFQ